MVYGLCPQFVKTFLRLTHINTHYGQFTLPSIPCFRRYLDQLFVELHCLFKLIQNVMDLCLPGQTEQTHILQLRPSLQHEWLEFRESFVQALKVSLCSLIITSGQV